MKYTKWVPIHSYSARCDSYLVQSRINLKTGLIKFKVTKIAGVTHQIDLGLNAADQFKKLEEIAKPH